LRLPRTNRVDGGTENNNQTVEAYIKKSHVDITKKIALRDIKQSNSMVEASNKILKHQYLFKQPIQNYDHLTKHLEQAIYDFNHQRPHCVLGLYTPSEVHYNQKPEIDKGKIKKQVRERIKTNLLNLWQLILNISLVLLEVLRIKHLINYLIVNWFVPEEVFYLESKHISILRNKRL